MPQSRSTTVGRHSALGRQKAHQLRRNSSRRTMMFPGWRSACTKLSWIIIFSKARQPIAATFLRCSSSTTPTLPLLLVPRSPPPPPPPLASLSPRSDDDGSRKLSMHPPSSNVSTSTAGRTSGKTGFGNSTSATARKLLLNCSRCDASSERSTCSKSGASNWRTLSSSRSHASVGMAVVTAASAWRMAKSRVMVASTAGCRTLTASSSNPSARFSQPRIRRGRFGTRTPFWTSGCSTARCTCAMEPDATGSRSNSRKSASSGCPKASSTTARVCAKLCDGASVCSFASSLHMSFGKRSERVAAHWPHLMKAGPAKASVRRKERSHAERPTSSVSAACAVSASGRKSHRRQPARCTNAPTSSTVRANDTVRVAGGRFARCAKALGGGRRTAGVPAPGERQCAARSRDTPSRASSYTPNSGGSAAARRAAGGAAQSAAAAAAAALGPCSADCGMGICCAPPFGTLPAAGMRA
mmetsp:Transcript_11854/g.39003  ORF Transcript_11854/g.39003 Transcript_11854/m.39003 type:complete len:470 (+) Transcript_11854:1066-2475(+)